MHIDHLLYRCTNSRKFCSGRRPCEEDLELRRRTPQLSVQTNGNASFSDRSQLRAHNEHITVFCIFCIFFIL